MDQLDPIPLEQRGFSPKRGHGGPQVSAYLVAAVLLALQLAVFIRVDGLGHQVQSLERQIGVNSNEVLGLRGRIYTLETEVRNLRDSVTR